MKGRIVKIEPFYIEEPQLIFASEQRINDPKTGLFAYGPSGRIGDDIRNPIIATTGIIGDRESIDGILSWLNRIKNPIGSKSENEIDFPGLSTNTNFRFRLQPDDQWIETITSTEVKTCENIENRLERIWFVLNLINQRIRSISQKDPKPDIVLIPIPRKLHKICLKYDQKIENIILHERKFGKQIEFGSEYDGFNFHSIIKILGMENNLLTQLVLPRTWRAQDSSKELQDPATRAWNFSVGTYYKASGIPWKLAQLQQYTCYAGISFFENVGEEETMSTSVAQIFLHTGESLVLRGDSFIWDKRKTKSPHLPKDLAEHLITKILKSFEDTHHTEPKRLVLHKTSDYEDEEFKGFLAATNGIKIKDFLAIRETGLRFYRKKGEMPIVRGTCFKAPDDEYFIFTTGFIPTLETYPGAQVPRPILMKPKLMDSPLRTVIEEILALSKLDWNNTNFCDHLPVTITVSRKVAKILAEPRAKSLSHPQIQYKWYM